MKKPKPGRHGGVPRSIGKASHAGPARGRHGALLPGRHGGVPRSVGSASHAGPVRPVRASKKPKKPRKPRRLALGEGVACCSAQAVGTLLGLSDAEVLALYWLTAGGPDDGATIEDTLAAASVLSRPAPEHSPPGADLWQPGPFVEPVHALILGLDLPEGPHAVLATADGWWSWGELYDPAEFPGAVIEEAWAVTW